MSGDGRNWFARTFGRPEKRAIRRDDVWDEHSDALADAGVHGMVGALRSIPVYAATNLIASELASLPIQTFQESEQTAQKVANPALFDEPSIFGTTFEWVQRMMTSVLLRGNAYGFITNFNDFGFPRQIEWLHPDDVDILDNRARSRPVWFYLGRELDPSRFVHIPGYVIPGEILGLSPIGLFARNIESALLAEKFGRDYFQNANTPASVLETDQRVDEGQNDVIVERFKRKARNRQPVVLGAGMTYRPITVLPNESQFLQTIQAKVNDIAAMYNIPAERIGGSTGSSRTYANREQDSQDLLTYTFRPWIEKVEKFFKRWTPERQFSKFNVDALVRADIATRYNAYSLALRDGWRSRDEVRALEDLSPLPGQQGEVFAPPPGSEPAQAGVRHEQRRVTDDDIESAERRLRAFFERQRDEVVGSRQFDVERWNSELAPILLSIGVDASEKAGRAAMSQLGLNSDSYNVDRTIAWLTAQAQGVAEGINESTDEHVADALDEDDSTSALRNTFAVAMSQGARRIARTHLTSASGFGAEEAVQQSNVTASKTWLAVSDNPRSTHAAMDGETVRVGETFSNGARWPGDSQLDPDERANCSCEMQVSRG